MAIDPKLRPAGEICRCDCEPTPVSAAVNGKAVAEVATERVPVRVPDCVGAKVTCKTQFAPAASVLPGGGQEPLAMV